MDSGAGRLSRTDILGLGKTSLSTSVRIPIWLLANELLCIFVTSMPVLSVRIL